MPIRPAADAGFEYRIPVVVIGGGACGLCAALAAKEAGAGVMVLERDERPTGSTSLSQGLIPAAGTRFQREKGHRGHACADGRRHPGQGPGRR